MSDEQQQCSLVSGSSLVTKTFLMPISDSANMKKNLSTLYYISPVFGRNACSWKCCGKSPLGFHITAGLPVLFRINENCYCGMHSLNTSGNYPMLLSSKAISKLTFSIMLFLYNFLLFCVLLFLLYLAH